MCAAVFVAACRAGGGAGAETRATTAAPGGSDGPTARPAVAVAVARAERRTLARHVTLTAPVEPIRRIGVNSQMTGTVLSVAVQEGDRVARGDVMAELDTREVAAQLERARATAANAQAAYRRAVETHDRHIITDAEFEQAKAADGTARSDVTLWETRLSFGRVRAPAAGMVTAKLVEAGSAVAPNQRMFELADESLFVVRVQASELDAVHLAAGASAEIVLDAYPEQAIGGRIRRVFPSADPQSRLVPVEVAIGTPPSGITVRPGFLARVRLDLERIPNALAIPSAALGSGTEGAYVYAIEADTIALRPIRAGLVTDGWTQIVQGLDEGEAVVTSGRSNLRPGARVRTADVGDTVSAAGTEASRQ